MVIACGPHRKMGVIPYNQLFPLADESVINIFTHDFNFSFHLSLFNLVIHLMKIFP